MTDAPVETTADSPLEVLDQTVGETISILEKAVEEYRGRLDYASQLLSLVVVKHGGRVDLTLEDLDVNVNGVQIDNVEDGGFVLTTFTDEAVPVTTTTE